MKNTKILSFFLALAMLLLMASPVAYASEVRTKTAVSPSNVVTYGDYSIASEENSSARYNILINTSNQTGQFALVYHDSPDYLYEFCFTLTDAPIRSQNSFWEDIHSYCFSNENNWKEVYLPAAITIEDKSQSQSSRSQARSVQDEIEYFESWITGVYGHEYSGNLLTTRPKNGTTFYLKSGFQAYARLSNSYYIAQTITVLGFITAAAGLIISPGTVAAIGLLTSGAGVLYMGQTLHQYTLRANWFRYATLTDGSGYPYGLCDKFIYYAGYVLDSGKHIVDDLSESTDYIPSSAMFNSYQNIIDAAYEEYLLIGYQDGNF